MLFVFFAIYLDFKTLNKILEHKIKYVLSGGEFRYYFYSKRDHTTIV
jgi:hypothetical protein